MNRLPPKEKQALSYVKENRIVPLHEFPFGSFRCESLIEKNYLLKICIPAKKYDDDYVEHYAVMLTPEGIDALDMNKISRNESRIALILSIIAIVFTFITGFTPLADWCRSWFSSLI
jgi:hypothetical protein